MNDIYNDIQVLEEIGIPKEMLTLYRHCLDTNDENGRKRLLRRFGEIKKRSLSEDRQKLSCLDYLITKIENM